MSYLRQKSDFNIDAAKVLISKGLYAPSVHCSYYSCFQLMKYAIKSFFGTTYKEQTASISGNPKQSTHKYVIDYIIRELKKIEQSREVQNLRRNIKDLQNFRIEADYENIEINYDNGQKALEKAEEIRSYLITNLKL
jgi:uncharacterized protein (UPF0332 family)